MSKNKAAMKVIVKYPVEQKEIRLWNGKKTCNVIVEDEAKLRYKLFAFEGSKAWDLKEGEEIDVEVKEPAALGKQGEVKLPGSGNGGKTFTRREYKTPTPELATEAAKFSGELFRQVKEQTGANESAAAIITAALIEKLC